MDFVQAEQLLEKEDLTCIIFGTEPLCLSRERGIRPLLKLIEEGAELSGLSAVDRVVGRAAAFAYVILGIRRVHAYVVSEPAKELLEQHGIDITYESLVKYIRNRTGDGRCPMESAVLGIEDTKEALAAIYRKRKELEMGDKG